MSIYNQNPLSKKLQDCLFAIAKHMEDNKGMAPTLSELASRIEPEVSKTAAFYRVKSLEERGYVEVDKTTKRNISLTDKALDLVKDEKNEKV